ncbi:MAG: Gldg family protein [Butyricimonas faecihominis]
MYLLICAYAAVGLFMSSLTSYQVVAAMLTLAVLAVLNYVKGWWQDIDFVRDITWSLALSGRSDNFLNGLICSEDFIYFLLVITLFLMFAIIKLKAVRQKSSWTVTWGKYIGVFVLAALLGYISSRPKMMFYYDVTETKMNTLTENSQEIMAKMKGGLTITTYVNLLDKHFRMGLPEERNRDLSRFNRYTRFKPEIDLKYVYYYDKADNKSLDERYPTLTDRERMIKIANNYDLDSNMFLRPEEIRQVIDLSGEKNRFVRQVVRESGEKTFLRVFDDAVVFPTEAEITAAFKRLVMDLPTVGFLKGHGERDSFEGGS